MVIWVNSISVIGFQSKRLTLLGGVTQTLIHPFELSYFFNVDLFIHRTPPKREYIIPLDSKHAPTLRINHLIASSKRVSILHRVHTRNKK